MKKAGEKRQRIAIWLKTPILEQKPKAVLLKDLNINRTTFERIKAGIILDKKPTSTELRQRAKGLKPIVKGAWQMAELLDVETLPLTAQKQLFDKLLFQIAMNPASSAKDRELYARRYGLFLDKSQQEVTHKFDASEHFGIWREAQKRLSELSGSTNRSSGLLPKHTLLPTKTRKDTG